MELHVEASIPTYYGLCSLEWFPLFLKGLKASVRFLRDYRDQLCSDLRAAGKNGVAQMFEGKAFTGFAKWRWGTIFLVCEDLSRVLLTFAGVWGSLVFVHKIRDNSLIKQVSAALTSVEWREHQFFFVHWYSKWLVTLQRWGQGCACHRAELEAGKSIDCHMKGRLLKVAFDHACKHLDDGLAEVPRVSFRCYEVLLMKFINAFSGWRTYAVC